MPGQGLRFVLLPGFDGSARLFGPFAQALGGGTEAVAYPPDARWGYEQLLPFVVDRLPKGRSVVVGESFSGPLALMVAAAAPGRVSAIVLVSSFCRLPLPAWTTGAIGWLDAGRAPRTLIEFWLTGKATPPALRAELLVQVRSLPRALVTRRLHAVLNVDVRRLADELRCPTLAIHGRHDRLIPTWWARRDLGRRRGMDFEVIDGPHMLLQTAPEMVAALVSAWVDRKGLHRRA